MQNLDEANRHDAAHREARAVKQHAVGSPACGPQTKKAGPKPGFFEKAA
jgi:hypothetical protein